MFTLPTAGLHKVTESYQNTMKNQIFSDKLLTIFYFHNFFSIFKNRCGQCFRYERSGNQVERNTLFHPRSGEYNRYVVDVGGKAFTASPPFAFSSLANAASLNARNSLRKSRTPGTRH